MEHSAAILTIDLGAIVANWKFLSESVEPARCGAVVKADAYGLGAVCVVRALLRAGCREFFVALVEEGVRLRESLKKEWPANARLHVLHGPLPGAEATCMEYGLVPVLNSGDQIERWRSLARRHASALPAAIQVDTGMARLGLSLPELNRLLDTQGALAGISPTLVMSHLVSAEDAGDLINQRQLHQFQSLSRHFPSALACLANSSGIFLGEDFHFDLVRPGAALYGVAPTSGQANPLRPVIRVQARLIQCREVATGVAVGYNHTWRAARATRIATVSVGYADGYLRSASNRAMLRLDGIEMPIIGRISMDTVTVDVTDVPHERLTPGTLLDVIDEIQDVNALALQANTNAYEILTSLGARYQRHYLSNT